MIATTTQSCIAHKFHRPRVISCELHHVVPQAWQKFWRPQVGVGLWHPETVALCPTGHRNVHHYIVAKMRVVAGLDHIKIPNTHEAQIAQEALSIWLANGGSLMDLVRAKQWGQA